MFFLREASEAHNLWNIILTQKQIPSIETITKVSSKRYQALSIKTHSSALLFTGPVWSLKAQSGCSADDSWERTLVSVLWVVQEVELCGWPVASGSLIKCGPGSWHPQPSSPSCLTFSSRLCSCLGEKERVPRCHDHHDPQPYSSPFNQSKKQNIHTTIYYSQPSVFGSSRFFDVQVYLRVSWSLQNPNQFHWKHCHGLMHAGGDLQDQPRPCIENQVKWIESRWRNPQVWRFT